MLENFKRINNKRSKITFIKLILAFFAFFIIPVIVASFALNTYTINIIEKQVENANFSLLMHTMDTVDNRFDELRRSIVDLSGKADILKLSYPVIDQTELSLNLIEITKNLVLSKSSNDFINGTFIYYKSNGILTTDQGVIDFDSYFARYYAYEGMSPKDWDEMFMKNQFFNIIHTLTVKSYDISNKLDINSRLITMVATLPFNGIPRTVIGIQVKEENVDEILKKTGLTEKGNVLIIDNKGNIIASSLNNGERKYRLNEETLKLLNANKSGNKAVNENGKTMVSFITSKSTGWKFVAMIPYNEISKKSDIIKTVTLVICVIFMFMGLIISYVSSKKFYSPIKDLLNLFDERKGKGSNATGVKGNEFTAIKSGFQDVLSQNKRLQEIMDIGISDMRGKFFLDLVYGRNLDNHNLLERTKKLEIIFPYMYFSISVIKFEFFSDAYKQYSQAELDHFNNKICSVINAVIDSENIKAYAFETKSDNYAVIINSDTNENVILKQMFNHFLELFEIDKDILRITISMTPFILYLSEISLLFRQANETVNYRTLKKENSIMEYGNLKEIQKNVRLYYPHEMEESIRNYLLSGVYQDAIIKVKEIVFVNYENDVPYELFTSILTGLLNLLVHVIGQKGISMNVVFDNLDNPYERIGLCFTVEDIIDFLSKKYEKVGKYILAQKTDTAEYKLKKIMDFINENYHRDIYLDLVADQVGMSSSYLSRFFKEQTGMGFIDYVNKIRIEKAKEMLIKTDAKLLDISEKTGFKNLSTFIRTFKRFEGVPPVTYKHIGT